MGPIRKPEVMSPAGYWPQLRAAIEAGADAVYFGLKHFSARAKVGFSLAELPEAMATLHRRGVKGYITFNTLVFDHELDEAARALAEIAEAGADALIVQDVGVARMAKQIAPGLDIHGSTQMSVTSADGVLLALHFGVSRVTLARELSLDQVRAIRAATDCELEIFVHGALCVSYSGQCFSSEAWGGRSANRGQCAQACRLPYEMIVDGEARPLGDARYLLSPGDLYALRQVPSIVGIGIAALKIEGRYKDADYVALTTAAYRQAVDEAWAGRELKLDRTAELRLEQVYSRGLGAFFLTGTNHQEVVAGRAPRHRGVLMGRVLKVTDGGVSIEPNEAHRIAPLKPGDGVVFDAADWRSPEEPEEGGRIFEIHGEIEHVELRFGNGVIHGERIRRGDLIWRTHDPGVDKAARIYTEAAAPLRKQAVTLRVVAHEGERLRTVWRVGAVSVTVESDAPLGVARHRAIDEAHLRAQLGRLGNTPYELAEVELEIAGAPFAPSSMLNRLRREAVEQLQSAQGRWDRRSVSVVCQQAEADPSPEREKVRKNWLAGESACPTEAQALAHQRGTDAFVCQQADPSPECERGVATLHLLVRTPEQLDAALELGPASITLDYLDLYGLRPSIDRVRDAGIAVRVASPRVLKPGEEKIVDFLLGCDCAILVRSAGLLEALRHREPRHLTGDFSLNAANVLTAREFFALGLQFLTPTYDLNAAQVAGLARQVGGERIEAVAYQHLPVFHTEHCVFCRFLSTGASYRDCGRPCEEHRVALRDTAGRAHPVMADAGCRNTVFGAEAQEASQHLETWRAAGIARFRLEFAHESADQVTAVTRVFEDALAGRRTGLELMRQLQKVAPQGVTQGSFFIPEDYLTLPVLQ
jgi:putative protease